MIHGTHRCRRIEVINLNPLADDESFTRLVHQCLGTEYVHPSVINLIRDKSDGNPLITRELSYSLLNEGFLMFRALETNEKSNIMEPKLDAASNKSIKNKKRYPSTFLHTVTMCTFNPKVELICPVPNTVHGIITARLDRLQRGPGSFANENCCCRTDSTTIPSIQFWNVMVAIIGH